MSLHCLSVPYVDAAPSELTRTTGLPRQRALCTKALRVGQVDVELRVLGMSHQVMIESEDLFFSETVACIGSGGPLSSTAGPRYSFSSTVERLSDEDFDDRVDLVISASENGANWLAGSFPGSRRAVTAIEVVDEPGCVAWNTWHAYPQVHSVVRTTSRYQLVMS